MRPLLAALLCAVLLTLGCGGGSSPPMSNPPNSFSISLSPSTVIAGQDGTQGPVTVTVTRSSGDTSSITLTTTSVPAGVNAAITSPGSGDSGMVTFTAQATGAPAGGSYPVTINASNSATSASANLTLVIAIVVKVQSTVNTSAGEDGILNTFMSTSFQPAEWDDQFFTANPEPGTTTTLNNLNSQHIRLQPVSQGTPEQAENSWDFSTLDAVLDPVISVADKSPELQLAVGPPWMDDPSSGYLQQSHFGDFANYAADVVEYYNTSAGFTDGNGHNHVHSAMAVTPVTWWGIFNEPNINGLTATQYVNLYNAVVPAMQAARSTVPIKFAAVELADFQGQPQGYLPTFVQNVTAPVDVVATHFYSSCNQSDTDAQVFGTIPGFVSDVQYIYSQLKTNPALANVPVWVTENNVNADYADVNGNSTCNPGQKFVTDQRGTSAFFAAWRPYVFSQLAQAGAQALYHWDFDADQQYGEVDFNTAQSYLSYWVDYWLQRYYPSCATCVASADELGRANPAVVAPPVSSILNLTSTESTTVETLATKSVSNPQCGVSFVVMIANHAVMNPATDDNGTGAPRTVIVDVSALGSIASANQLTIDSTTDPVKGPSSAAVTPASRLAVTLNGYGVTFLQLQPTPPPACAQ
ncbi:MAG TPA: glycosyl hydrolase [Terriglobia bacterium]|nr:glycosyl hydrolase [Terriglobia bacterium]